MQQWFIQVNDLWQFKFGVEDYAPAREAAKDCSVFLSDDEDEHTDNVARSCFNCMYRRWQPSSFQCHKRSAAVASTCVS
ncbi:hypothetical protein [Shewanella pneumatophori]|uniref:Uncharacterized protein n=1 Tax=Shewanella pneumatophori TaxID=314092 RepID=A0A9X1ZBZ7_9GAMM|nr:hypothetical protein [Shewanella pneumatophori]MCL1138252.1 hypothetical protein [Shewanella pneumatophori]